MHCALNLPDEVINGDDRIKDPSIIDGNLDKAELELNKIHDVPLINGNVYAERSKVHIGPNIYTDKAVVVQYPYSAKKDEFEPYGFCDIIQTPPKKTDNDNKVFIQDNEKFKIKRRYLLYGAVIFILIAVVTTLVTIFLLPTSKDGTEKESGLKIIKRAEWHAENSTEPFEKLKILPPPYVIVAHTVSQQCNTTDKCKSVVRSIQALHISLNYGDIGYNFLVGGDGNVYEGLGWDMHGAHTLPFNSRSIGLAFIGDFSTEIPPRKQVIAAQLLLEEGVRLNKLDPRYKVFGHKQVIATESPGAELMKIIEDTWPHWAPYDPDVDD